MALVHETQIAAMLSKVQWKELELVQKEDTALPYATHEGVLNIGDYPLRVYKLSNGQAVIEESDMLRFIGISSEFGRGSGKPEENQP